MCLQMWRTAGGRTLYVTLLLSQLLRGGGAVAVECRSGERGVTFRCRYDYEDGAVVSQLSVQWRSPGGELLCHYIKHKAFKNCSAGYALSYRPGAIALTIQLVRPHDFGTHVCSISKPHDFSDYSVELVQRSDSVTSAPTGGVSQSGLTWRLLLHSLICLFVYM